MCEDNNDNPLNDNDDCWGDSYDYCISGDDEDAWNREIEKAIDRWEP